MWRWGRGIENSTRAGEQGTLNKRGLGGILGQEREEGKEVAGREGASRISPAHGQWLKPRIFGVNDFFLASSAWGAFK
jgi:hypothetical protein